MLSFAGLDFFGNRFWRPCVLYRVIFPSTGWNIKASLCLSPLGWEGQFWSALNVLLWCWSQQCLPCAHKAVPKKHFHFSITKVGVENRLVFIYSAVSHFWGPGSGARYRAVSFLTCWCLHSPSPVSHSKHISFVQEGNFLFPLWCTSPPPLPPPSRSKMFCQLLFIWWFKCPYLVSFSLSLQFFLPFQRLF